MRNEVRIYNKCADDDNHERNIDKKFNCFILFCNHFNGEIADTPDGNPPDIQKCDDKKGAEFFIGTHSM